MTPHASFATVPFSFSLEKNPGLSSGQPTPHTKKGPSMYTHMPKNFLLFKNDVAFMI